MDNEKKQPNFWVRGKQDQMKFYDIKLNRKTNIITFLFGLISGALLLLPFGIMIYQYLLIYSYTITAFPLYITIVWILIMIFNGISNYMTVKLAQVYNKDMQNLQEIDAKNIFWYQIFNPGFAFISFLLIILFGLRLL